MLEAPCPKLGLGTITRDDIHKAQHTGLAQRKAPRMIKPLGQGAKGCKVQEPRSPEARKSQPARSVIITSAFQIRGIPHYRDIQMQPSSLPHRTVFIFMNDQVPMGNNEPVLMPTQEA